jgi:riboflavin synthase
VPKTAPAQTLATSQKIGDSIAVDGVCLTITAIKDDTFTVQAIPETLNKTIIKNYRAGTIVNLERPLKLQDELHGHLVQGHVDFAGKVTATALATAKPRLTQAEVTSSLPGDSKILAITFPPEYAKFFALKGSVTMNGVSLTISSLHEDSFEVSLIPQTINTTNLGTLVPGQEVNIEVDLLARYLDRLLQDKAQQINYEFLQERGFI